MAQAIKINNAEEALINTVIGKVREGKYEITALPEGNDLSGKVISTGYSLSGKVIVTSTVLDNTRRVAANIAGNTFTGKFVRRLEKAIEKSLEGPKAKGGKKKVLATESEVESLMALI